VVLTDSQSSVGSLVSVPIAILFVYPSTYILGITCQQQSASLPKCWICRWHTFSTAKCDTAKMLDLLSVSLFDDAICHDNGLHFPFDAIFQSYFSGADLSCTFLMQSSTVGRCQHQL